MRKTNPDSLKTTAVFTPDEDDSHLCYLRVYSLRSHRNASRGEIWLYNPDLEMVHSCEVSVLECVVHKGCDGLTANPDGETHGVIIPVPVSLMEKPGTYRFVLHFYDDYADSYKDHKVKPALEVNAELKRIQPAVIIKALEDPMIIRFEPIGILPSTLKITFKGEWVGANNPDFLWVPKLGRPQNKSCQRIIDPTIVDEILDP